MNLALPREDIAAGLLAAAVHGFFVLLLVFGVSWQIHDPQPIMAELWQALPELPPPPEPAPMPVPEAKPLPAPENKAADIALEKKQQKEKLLKQKQAQALEKKRQDEKRRRDEAREMELALEREAAHAEAEKNKREREKKLADQKRREALQHEEEDMQRRMLEESLVAEAGQLKAKAAAEQRASEIAKTVARYKDMISAKVRGNTRLPENLPGNPEAEFAVDVLPTGEIAKVRLIKGSGNAAYDQAVQRAIEKSTPLPLPPDKSAAAEFRNLVLKHKARE